MSILDLFKQCNFRISLRNNKHIELMVQEVNIPGITLGELNLNWQGMRDKRTGDSMEFNDLNLTVVIDEDLAAYKEIFNSLILAHNPDTNKLEIQAQVFDGFLSLLTNKNNFQHQLHFYDAWIKSIDDIQMTHNSSEDEQITLSMVISYNYFLLE